MGQAKRRGSFADRLNDAYLCNRIKPERKWREIKAEDWISRLKALAVGLFGRPLRYSGRTRPHQRDAHGRKMPRLIEDRKMIQAFIERTTPR